MNFIVRSSTAMLVVALLAGCAGNAPQVPIEDRSPTGWLARASTPPAVAAPPATAAAPVPPAAGPVEPGYYLVQKGDTLYSIALDNGQDYREVAEWNSLPDPSQIRIGQVLRVIPPGTLPLPDDGDAVAVARPIGDAGGVEQTPLDGAKAVAPGLRTAPKGGKLPYSEAALAAAAAPVAVTPAPVVVKPAATAAATSPATPAGAASRWLWPADGKLVGTFGSNGNKGVDIAGKAGDAVKAAGDGKVVYSGSGLRGYGQMVIVKHDAEYLTAYAHNRKILVKEGQAVKRGERIAEMGDSDADQVKLHFELRRRGKPVDPLKHLPAR